MEHCDLLGRKIIVDTYGGMVVMTAFSPERIAPVDRSALCSALRLLRTS